jgi:hypothetical protein
MGIAVDLLNPPDAFRENYLHQLQQTIDAYSIPLRVLGEPLQNAIDAAEETASEKGHIRVSIDFDKSVISVADNGPGFPQNPSLLFLGGTGKLGKPQRGRVGVGIKVTIYSSKHFTLRARTADGAWRIEIKGANKFQEIKQLPIETTEDPKPLEQPGTLVEYALPPELVRAMVSEIVQSSLPEGSEGGFGKTIQLPKSPYPSAFAALLTAFLRRYTYLGDVLPLIDKKRVKKDLTVEIAIHCSDPASAFGPGVGALFGKPGTQAFTVPAAYLTAAETVTWAPKGFKKPEIYNDTLGDGGNKLERTDGFNHLIITTPEEYKALLVNKRGRINTSHLPEYEKLLFPKINGIVLTIGRIPDFDTYLPGGSARLISANGVVTAHDVNPVSGRNQEYVRCLDLTIDVDAELNYGKTQLTDMQLVNRIRRFVNDAYAAVLQNAAGNWVGKMPAPEEEEEQIHVQRPELGVEALIQRKEPACENDVIALFFELAGRGYFPDYQIFGLSSYDRYDGKAAILREADEPEKVFNPQDDSKLRNIEFKLHAGEVIRDFERGQKYANEIALVIAWQEGETDSKEYKIYDVQHSEAYKASPKRVFPRVTKYIYDAKQGTEVQIVLLQQVVGEIKEEQAKATTALT